ncbi:MAG: hypothetical protein ISQ95_05335 [Flavobacteriales bacterium]|nr:hypothetical protein [Flavobacteriales bacterium]
MIYRLTKYIILILIFLVLIISGSLFIITKIYGEEIKELALEEINQQLTSQIIVENIELSAFTHFPSISLEFKNILINDPIIIDDTLLHANKAYLNFDIYDLINKRYIVRKLVLTKGMFNILTNEKSEKNYLVFKKNDNSENKSFKFLLNQFTLIDFKISYKNSLLNQEFDFKVKNSNLIGQFSNKEYDLNIISNMKVNTFILDDINYINSKTTKTEVELHVINNPFSINIKKGGFEIGKMNFLVQGNYLSAEKDIVDLKIKGNQIEILEIFSVLPKKYSKLSKQYISKGILNFEGHLNGELNNNKRLNFSVNFNALDAYLKDKLNDIELEKVNVEGVFNNQKQELKIINFSSLINEKTLNGFGSISNFKDPMYSFTLNGRIDLNNNIFSNYLKDLSLEGETEFTLESKIVTKKGNLLFEKINGNLNSKKIVLEDNLKSIHLKLNNLDLNFSKKELVIITKKSSFNKDDFDLKMSIKNWDKIMFSDSKKLKIIYDLNMTKFHLDDFIKLFSVKDSSGKKYQFEFEGELFAEELYYDSFIASNVSAEKIIFNNSLRIKNLIMESFDGAASLNIYNSDLSAKNQTWFINGDLFRINSKKLMKSFDNFNQEFLINEQINGEFSSDFSSTLVFDSESNFNLQKSKFKSENLFENIVISENNFLNDIFLFFKKSVITRNIIDIDYYDKRISKVNFKNFNSNIIFSNGTLKISKTNFKNNVLDFTFYGNYKMNDLVDYHLNFNWADIVKKNKSKSNIVEENKIEGKQLFLKIWGPLDDLTYGFDKSEIKNERRVKIKNEKETIKKIIKGEIKQPQIEPEEFELEIDEIEQEEGELNKPISKNINPSKKKKDSTKFNKFLKKLGVEEKVKTKPEFEIDQ